MRANPDADGILAVTFSSDGIISSVSATAERVTGYDADLLVGKPLTHIMADCSAFEVPQMLERAARDGSWEGAIVYRSRTGRCVEARTTLTTLPAGNEIPSGYLLASGPETAAPDGVAVGEVAARLRAITHELNNPLAVTMGFAQLILLNTRCEGQLRSDMEKLYSELKRVVEVVDTLHGYAVSLQGHPRDGQGTAKVVNGD